MSLEEAVFDFINFVIRDSRVAWWQLLQRQVCWWLSAWLWAAFVAYGRGKLIICIIRL